MPGIAAGCAGAGIAAGGIAIGLPAGGASIGTPARFGAWTTAVPVLAAGAWRPEFSERKVAQPRTSATAAPAARPRLSRRLFCRATIG